MISPSPSREALEKALGSTELAGDVVRRALGHPASATERVLQQIAEARLHGGSAGAVAPEEVLAVIGGALDEAESVLSAERRGLGDHSQELRRALTQIATIAVAAIEAIDRGAES